MGDKAIIENLIIKIQRLCYRFQRFIMLCILFATILSPAFVGFEMCLHYFATPINIVNFFSLSSS